MDTIIKTTLALFLVILAAFSGFLGYYAYVDFSYRNTITGNYSYSCTVSTDAPLYNVTLFLPVPEDPSGNSPVVSAYSGGSLGGVPADWKMTLYGTGKATMVKVVSPSIIPPAGTGPASPYRITLSSDSSARSAIVTRDIAGSGVIFRPVQDRADTACSPAYAGTGSRCYTYTTSLYADYDTSPDTVVTITSAIDGRNTWNVFGPHANEYHAGMSLTLRGANHGWVVSSGTGAEGIGSYEPPFSI